MRALVIAATLGIALVCTCGRPTLSAHASPGTRPLPGPITKTFDPPAQDWLAGHRGVDVAGSPGDVVRATSAGDVSWIGTIDGVAMLTISHANGLRTTFQPVQASLAVGTSVAPGDPVGVLLAGHPGCPAAACLHWGLKSGDVYLDPTAAQPLDPDDVRLLPRDASPRTMPSPEELAPADVGTGTSGQQPVGGPITSPFGYRINPISGAAEFHDGVDIGAPCGAPVRASATGTVDFAGTAGGYGLRVQLQHGGAGSSYSHLSQLLVSPGQTVRAGTVVGLVGTTGFSTGCHLHWSTTQAGVSVDPLG